MTTPILQLAQLTLAHHKADDPLYVGCGMCQLAREVVRLTEECERLQRELRYRPVDSENPGWLDT